MLLIWRSTEPLYGGFLFATMRDTARSQKSAQTLRAEIIQELEDEMPVGAPHSKAAFSKVEIVDLHRVIVGDGGSDE
jgi:hypothetical protein